MRELENVIERAAITAPAGGLRFDLPPAGKPDATERAGSSPAAPGAGGVRSAAEMKQQERENLAAALRHAEGKIYGATGAARLLGMKPTTLLSRLAKLGLKPTRHVPPP